MITEEEYRMKREAVLASLSEKEKRILDKYAAGHNSMNTRAKPVVIITRHKVTRYDSITDASRAISISKPRLLRALEREDGLVIGIKPAIYIDYAMDEVDE